MTETVAVMCSKCGASNEKGSFYCGNCKWNLHMRYEDGKASKQGFANGAPPVSVPVPGPLEKMGLRAEKPDFKRRYDDAYRNSRMMVGLGDVAKIAGSALGIFVAMIGFSVGDWRGLIGGLLVGGSLAAFFYLCGVVVSAQGQILRAILDGAVSVSPFLDKGEKAEVMGS